jgi:hypothetical protein
MVVIEDLLANLRPHFPQIKRVRFLVQHEPLNDTLLEFSFPWPIEGFQDTQSPPRVLHKQLLPETCLMIFNPAGDSHTPGRIIGESFERTVALQCVQALKMALEQASPTVRIIVTHAPGEVVSQFRTASYVNTLDAHLYLHIGVYHTLSETPEISLYAMAVDSVTDTWVHHDAGNFIPFYYAHRQKIRQSRELLGAFHAHVATQRPIPFQVHDIRVVPYKPLVGIAIPAIAIEIGLPSDAAWQQCIEPLVTMLRSCMM